ncbi:MAG: Asp-tRNA(Asn)/Glu-tRNA(Gln) amidotransferase subunit GatC [Chitinispirillia bacterium]
MITKHEVERIADLAKLAINEEEKVIFTKDLNSILYYMDQLNAINTGEVEPTAFMAPNHNPLREDVIKKSLPARKILQNGPMVKNGFFAVPKIIG